MKLSTTQAFKAALFLLGAFVVSACTQNANKKTLNPLLQDSSDIISTRPQNSKHFIGILKLKHPALLQGSAGVENETLLKAVLKEQEETIVALKNLSPEIQVLYRYKMVLNAISIVAPIEFQDRIKALGQVAYAEGDGKFSRPVAINNSNSVLNQAMAERNSAKFIGAELLNKQGITGKGVKVGIIDTGIDYTHAMFKGAGTEEAFKAIDPSGEAVGFPNSKVVGGIDLVGTEFDAANPEFTKRLPKPDMNPMDEGGHGTHVAGSVAGHGDGVVSYNGMAPDADLYAIKVFGADGSTSDSVVIASLEYSADPNGDGNSADKLDVVNMSLGSGYGNPHILYSEAIKNLVQGGVVVVASGGNSGHVDYIVGSPGTSTEALSVAASVDNGDQNWKFGASKIHLGSQTLLVEAIEAVSTKKIAEAGHVTGELVYLGLAIEELTEEQKGAVKGKVAFIDRGIVPFNDKIKRAAEAGAIGVVVGNNSAGNPISMGTTDKFEIPAIMITLAIANQIKEAQKTNPVTIEFKAEERIEKSELIDTLTGFSSKGPRSVDGLIKPEIAAPGNNVISAKMGGGAAVVQMSGTSMAAPHMAGVIALIKQAQPTLTSSELKNIAMGTAKTIGEKGKDYPISMQGAGRVQADRAALSKLVAAEPSISIGEMAIESKKTYRKTLSIKSLSETDQTLTVIFEGSQYVSLVAAATVVVKANTYTELPITLTFDASKMKEESIREMDGFIKFKNGEEELYRIPVLAVAHRLSAIQASELTVQATSSRDAVGAAATVKLNNANMNAGLVGLFNLLGRDERKPIADTYMTNECDLQLAGYRILTKKNQKQEDEDVLQIAIKTYKPMTTWHTCDVSLLIDSNGDGIPEQELLGSSLKSIPNQISEEFATTLMDATKARELRKNFEAEVAAAKDDLKKLQELKSKEKYDAAILDQRDFIVFNNSTIVVLEATVAHLAKTADGRLAFKMVVSHNEPGSVQFDDYLAGSKNSLHTISLDKQDQSFVGLPEVLTLKSSETLIVPLTKGMGTKNLLVLMPQNKFSTSDFVTDAQSQVVKPKYK